MVVGDTLHNAWSLILTIANSENNNNIETILANHNYWVMCTR